MKNKFIMHSGIEEFDELLGNIYSGDNIVFQINSIEDYIPFVHPFCYQAKKEGRKLVYFRFAQHTFLLPEGIEAEVYNLNAEIGFEAFITKILNIIEEHGYGACYVFDCLSELSADWYSDRMLGNFFMLTCPYLYDFETATYFAIFKTFHTELALNAIHQTAQVVLNIYRNNGKIFVQPLKVIDRASETRFMLHEWRNKRFVPVTNSATISSIMSNIPQMWLSFSGQLSDLWTKYFSLAHHYLTEKNISETEKIEIFKKLLRMMISRDEKFLSLAEKYFDLKDIVNIGKRLIGTGLIGGKASGMLLARAILEKTENKWKDILETHDSFFIGSDVYYTFITHNKLWWARRALIKSKNFNPENISLLKQKFLEGTFPPDILIQFKEILDYFGQSPIIIRSSSLLEDAYGNAFSGKYESIFCSNQEKSIEERLNKFTEAVKIIYASTISIEALSYREHFRLLDREEQMALLVQRVSGDKYEDYYYPQVSGVGFSFNPYVWNKDIDPNSGVIRIVVGLGTRAVDRQDDDYTRIVALNVPEKRPEYKFDDITKFSQRKIDVIDLHNKNHTVKLLEEVIQKSKDFPISKFFIKNEELENKAKEYNLTNIFPYVLTFNELLLNTNFVANIKEMLDILKRAYNHHVDIEFTLNFFDGDNYKINLLQCRPFQTKGELTHVSLPKYINKNKIILKSKGPIIGNSVSEKIDRIIYVSSNGYTRLSNSEKYQAARIIGQIVNHESSINKKIALIGPGRWGTTSVSLGIPVQFHEIKKVSVICEVAEMHEGLVPDISLGTHFFNDLVEMEILYLGIYPQNKEYILNRDFFLKSKNNIEKIIPDWNKWEKVIFVLDYTAILNADVLEQNAIFYLE